MRSLKKGHQVKALKRNVSGLRVSSCLLMACLFGGMAFFHAQAWAGQEQTFNNNLSWAKNIPATKSALNVEDYCAAGDLNCQQKVHKPDQVGMNSAQINSKKTSTFFSDPQANAVQSSFDKGRPTINPNDSTYRTALIAQSNAYEISHGISNAYADCESGMTCTIENYLQHCSMPTNEPVKCERTAEITAGTWSYGQAQVSSGSFIWNMDYHNTVITGIPTNATNATITFSMLYGTPGSGYGTATITANGTVIGTAHSRSSYTYSLDGVDLSSGQVILATIRNGILALSTRPTITVKWRVGHPVATWSNNCSEVLPSCTETLDECIEGPETRTLGGQSLYLPCWKYQKTYLCETEDTCVPDKPIVSRTCKTKLMDTCIEDNVVQEFETKSCQESSLICGEDSFCLDGSCYEETPTQNGDFSKAASMLAAVSKAAEDITDPPLIFTGKNQQCSIKVAGIANCCKDGGWGTDINVTSCSSEEKALGAAQEEKLTIPLGTYCAKKVLGACIKKKRSYCVFDSKLARIIQEQGRPQIGRGFGSAKNPDCSAITPEEMQQMNFSNIDFSDFYGEMAGNINMPNTNEIKSRIQSAYEK